MDLSDDLKQIGKKKRHKKVFQSSKDLLPETKVKSFVADFKKDLWQGLRELFGTPQIHGCSFHFGQALWRKVQKLGLQVTNLQSTPLSYDVNVH
ncbi:hypothetical protein CHS0354_036605 [Potamilus streckersoni]|uniref:Uncharacterized protein n=1 Tax=Potamilus streckersoni TaxID=2493646 RepID=A0AAE0TFC4_9BIVA|nr:hypothetical protein CHS0354_036605 [Potamilus streckersoni]